MSKQAFITNRAQGEALSALGADVTFLCPADRTGKAWSLMEVVLPKHAGPPPHDHPWDEAYYVIEGEVVFSLDGQSKTVRSGDFIYAPGGTLHGFQGSSDQPARMLIFDAPAHAESFFRDVDQAVKSPADFHKVPEIGLKHQIRFIPPAQST